MNDLVFSVQQLREWIALAERQHSPGIVVRVEAKSLVVGLRASQQQL